MHNSAQLTFFKTNLKNVFLIIDHTNTIIFFIIKTILDKILWNQCKHEEYSHFLIYTGASQ